jgi:hypothetical protein
MSPKQTGVEVMLDHDDRDVFHIVSTVRRALMLAGVRADVAAEYTEAALQCHSYDDLLEVTKETVKVT